LILGYRIPAGIRQPGNVAVTVQMVVVRGTVFAHRNGSTLGVPGVFGHDTVVTVGFVYDLVSIVMEVYGTPGSRRLPL